VARPRRLGAILVARCAPHRVPGTNSGTPDQGIQIAAPRADDREVLVGQFVSYGRTSGCRHSDEAICLRPPGSHN
jgi:hypothetical protein